MSAAVNHPHGTGQMVSQYRLPKRYIEEHERIAQVTLEAYSDHLIDNPEYADLDGDALLAFHAFALSHTLIQREDEYSPSRMDNVFQEWKQKLTSR